MSGSSKCVVVEAYAVQSASENTASVAYPETQVNEMGLRNFLMSHDWPDGLQECILKSAKKMPIRYFICDDSGSMQHNDGKKILRGAKGKDRCIKLFDLSTCKGSSSSYFDLSFLTAWWLVLVGRN